MYKNPFLRYLMIVICSVMLPACSLQLGAAIQWDSKDQILMSEKSQVRMRSLQTRVYDTTDKNKILQVVVATLQDLFFDLDVMDENLGVVSGKKLYHDGGSWEDQPTYYNYRTDNLVIFSTNYRTYGPFHYRNNLIRISVTIRPKGETQSLVRASIQHNIRAVEDAEVYQHFFKLLEQSKLLSSEL